MPETLTVQAEIAADLDPQRDQDRFSRLRLIPWWDQAKIQAAKVLVVGAGALGNEVLKNLALLGFLNVVVVDLDFIETSNLSRSVLFRASDVGLSKAAAIARGYNDLLPEATVRPLVANVMQECGLGLFAWADLILAGLDNREARLWINRAAWKVNRPWIDGAIEGINGVARVFLPGEPPCYECTLGETDWAILNRRMSCNLLLHEANPQGRTPTTPTISSIIGGIQAQEAVKVLHGLPTLAGKGYVFEGLHHTSYVTQYTENPDCMSHDTLERIIELPMRSSEITLEALAALGCKDLAAEQVVVEFSRDVIYKLVCPRCGEEELVFAPVGAVDRVRGQCASCNAATSEPQMRVVRTLTGYNGEPELSSRTLDSLGVPLFDIFTVRSAESELGYCIAGDAVDVLGPLAPPIEVAA
jgi:adenylyltransferase/sulfurtransferase